MTLLHILFIPVIFATLFLIWDEEGCTQVMKEWTFEIINRQIAKYERRKRYGN